MKSDIFTRRLLVLISYRLLRWNPNAARSLPLSPSSSSSSSPSRGLTCFLGLPRLPLLPPPALFLSADGGEKKEELITSLMEKGELCQDAAGGGGGREVIFNTFHGNHIFRAAEGVVEEGRLTLTQISSSVSLDCVQSTKIVGSN